MTSDLPEWLTRGAEVAVIFPHINRRPVVDTGRVTMIDDETVRVTTADTVYRFHRPTLTLFGTNDRYSPRLAPATDAHVVAANMRSRVHKIGRTMISLSHDVRFQMEADDVADLIAALDGLRQEISRAIVILGDQIPPAGD